MTSEQWTRVQQIFDEALALVATARPAFLDEACAGDLDLRGEVASLLDAFEEEGPVDVLSVDLIAPLLAGVSTGRMDGRRIGAYRILHELAQGGMGTVYLAERADPDLSQRVALKLIRPGVVSGAVLRRFLQERQILARLAHPHIARFLDGGVTDDGQPYFAMEYVEGLSLDAYCDTHRLPVEERLRLFCDVCAAVQYAHHNLVVHRDLKPTNILVTTPSAGSSREGQVKLLDFGIAKLLAAEEEGPLLTRTNLQVMTPAYAAPEQVRGEAVTTATDVYALGLILFELLTGERPYRVDTLSPGEVERVICETDPPRPSTVVGREQAGTEGIQARRTTAELLRRRLSGDLDTIMLKALQKEPERRYASAEQLLDDLRRHLTGLPVRARPDTLRYRTSRFVRRHRVAVVAAALVVLSLLGGIAGTAWQARQAVRQARIAEAERDRAQQEAEKAQEVSTFLIDLFNVADPGHARGETITARELLDQGAARIAALQDQPEVQASMMDVMGQVYHSLGLFDQAAPLLEGALALRQVQYGDGHEGVAAIRYHLGRLRYDQGVLSEAEGFLRSALQSQALLLDPLHPDLSATRVDLARVLREQRQDEEAEALLNAALPVLQERLGAIHPDLGAAQYELALIYHDRHDFAEAEVHFRAAVEAFRSIEEEVHPIAATAREQLATLLHFQGNLEEAEPLYTEALALRKRLYNGEHPDIAAGQQVLAELYHDRGDLARAESLFQVSLAMGERLLGRSHIDVVPTLRGLASVRQSRRAFSEAESLFVEVLALDRQNYGPDHPAIVTSLRALADCQLARQKYAQGKASYQEALDMSLRLFGEAHTYIAEAYYGLGRVAWAEGDRVMAVEYFRKALAVGEKVLRPEHPFIQRYRVSVAHGLPD